MTRRALAVVFAVAFAVLLFAPPAAAHPLGNFTVSHYDGLRIARNAITDHAVVDSAEIPTAQAASSVDADGDGETSAAERARYGSARCDALARDVSVSVDGRRSNFVVQSASFRYQRGAAGLSVSRLTCELKAPVAIRRSTTVAFVDRFAADRVGWHEITAVGEGVVLHDSPVPGKSISDELRRYPDDLLRSPLDIRSLRVEVTPGFGTSTFAPGAGVASRSGFVSRTLDDLNRSFNDLVGRRDLTVTVAFTAIALAMLLGAGHAVMPGHGKTVMAAYIAGRQGSVRDAFVVGATVTATHTLGVLVLGLALTVSASLAGEAVLQWLGVVSGLIVVALGIGLLSSALRSRRHDHGWQPTMSAGREVRKPVTADVDDRIPALLAAGHVAHVHHDHGHDHDHGHHHDHDDAKHHTHHDNAATHRHGLFSHSHEPDHARRTNRRGLIGMGIAGGLVPSPTALVIMLAAIALGRAFFGVVLVLSYGLGMAATLTAAGLALVVLRDRYQARPGRRSRFGGVGRRWIGFLPIGTACLVMGVGALLAGRSLGVV